MSFKITQGGGQSFDMRSVHARESFSQHPHPSTLQKPNYIGHVAMQSKKHASMDIGMCFPPPFHTKRDQSRSQQVVHSQQHGQNKGQEKDAV